jgi:nucleoside-diphosphate-sugar epimerase
MSQQTIAVIDGSGFISTRRIDLLVQEGRAVRIVDTQNSKKHTERWTADDVRDTDDLLAGLVWLTSERTD